MKDNLRIWVLGAVLLGGALLVGGWFVGVQPLLATAAANDASTAQADQQNQALQVKLLALQAAERNIGPLRIEAQQAGNAVPSSLDAQSFVNRINVLAAEDDVKVTALTPATPLAYTPPDTGMGKVEAFTDSRISAANLAVIPLSVEVTGSSAHARAFLADAQHDSRLFLVNGLTVAQTTDGSGVNATLSGFVYALKAASAS